ncbi:MAG: hypothetical protein AB1603_07220 [Chloroflexota bacterium]
MKKLAWVVAGIVAAGALLAAACSPGWTQPPQGSYGPGGWGGGGMMGGPGGMMGGGGMMGNGPVGNPTGKQVTLEQAAEAVRSYLGGYGPGRLELKEVMEFAWNFYAEIEEEDTGIHAMELLVDKYTGRVYPEQGPNMMWNAKYSMMSGMMGGPYRGGAVGGAMPVTPEQARTLAQQYLDSTVPGLTVAEADTFYGYYTLHTLEDGQVEGMLSVNGYTGAVWYHSWHGPFIAEKDFD